jgi:predicted TIM-barrel fold metal-dependent hydrolase
MTPDSIPIVDCHAHFLDADVHTYPVFSERNPGFEALVGDYTALPRRYLPRQYFEEAGGFNVTKIVWAEFISTDPIREVRWAEDLFAQQEYSGGIIGKVDFSSPDIAEVIGVYASFPHVRAVRQHLAWHPTNPLLRYAGRPDLLTDKNWQKSIGVLRKYHLACELEIMSPQLADFAAVARSYPDIQFVLPLMGWPTDVTAAGRDLWKRDMKPVSDCANVAVKIFGMECIFGLGWTTNQIRPWILDLIELFGPARCMYASHMPIARLGCTFQRLYGAYLDVVSDLSAAEKQRLFSDTAIEVYRLSQI